MSKQTKTRPTVNRRLDELRDIRVVIPPALADRLRRYRRHVGIEDARNYVRYCVMITTQLLQLTRTGHHIFVVGAAGDLCYELSFDSADLGFDADRLQERLESFEF